MGTEIMAHGWGVILELEELQELLSEISIGQRVWTAEFRSDESKRGFSAEGIEIVFSNPEEVDWPTPLSYGFPVFSTNVMLWKRIFVFLHPSMATPLQSGKYREVDVWKSDILEDFQRVGNPFAKLCRTSS